MAGPVGALVLLQILLRRNRAVEGRLIELLELAGRHVVDFGAAQRAHELLALVERERLQVVARAHDMRRQEDQQILLRRVARIVAEEVAQHRNVGQERNALAPFSVSLESKPPITAVR